MYHNRRIVSVSQLYNPVMIHIIKAADVTVTLIDDDDEDDDDDDDADDNSFIQFRYKSL